jgi:hypothetical protein
LIEISIHETLFINWWSQGINPWLFLFL